MSQRDIALSICTALGIPTQYTKHVTIELDATEPPLVKVTRMLSDQWDTQVTELFGVVPRVSISWLDVRARGASAEVSAWFEKLADKYDQEFQQIGEDCYFALRDAGMPMATIGSCSPYNNLQLPILTEPSI